MRDNQWVFKRGYLIGFIGGAVFIVALSLVFTLLFIDTVLPDAPVRSTYTSSDAPENDGKPPPNERPPWLPAPAAQLQWYTLGALAIVITALVQITQFLGAAWWEDHRGDTIDRDLGKIESANAKAEHEIAIYMRYIDRLNDEAGHPDPRNNPNNNRE